MIPCPRLPVFIPAFEGGGRLVLRGTMLVDGVDSAVAKGIRAEVREGGTVLCRGGDGELAGELVWPDPTKYDEAIFLLDARFEAEAGRVKCKAFDERVGCDVDCWAYLCPRA